jgi:copper resistance protein C
MRAHLIKGWIVAILATMAVALVAVPARAHAELESSEPADGASLATAPAEITLTFGEELLAAGSAVTLTEVETGAALEAGPAEVTGDTVSVAWPESSPAGELRADYRVVSTDGHPVEGSITFTVEEAVGPSAAVAVNPVAASADPTADTGSEPASDPAASPSATPQETDDGGGVLIWVVGLGLAILVGASAGIWVMRRTR